MKKPCQRCGRECEESAGKYVNKLGRGQRLVKRFLCGTCAEKAGQKKVAP